MSEEDIFVEAIEISDRARRKAFLDEACAGNASLRSSIDELLSMHDTAGDFLETPALETGAPVDDVQVGTVVGRYRLVEKIGEGGFGDVWKAEQQEPVRRSVALKVIKPGMDTRRVIARFETERQVLAIMNHRNIAAVLDAGSTQLGRPYFVMELVDGPSIDDYCDQKCMTVRQRLELFLQICRAVQHAHQKGIVHRDLKPSNILVTVGDTRADPKIIDFGIAKAMQNSVDLDVSATAPQQLMGTPEYMSPEQMAGEADIDTRTDVYALGGVLYKLLVGVAPLDVVSLRRSGLDELTRAIREDDAPRPSTRILRLDDAANVAAKRDTQPAALSRSLRGDLDAIVAKTLAKERARRYGSASDLARDVERYLACEPVSAAPPGLLYRTQKFIRRNQGWVLAASLVSVALIVGAIGLTSADRARRNEANLRRQAELKEQIADYQRKAADEQRRAAAIQRELARAKANEALRVATMLEGVVAGASPRGGKRVDFTARQQLDELADSLGAELTDYPEIEARLRRTIGRAYLDLIEIKLAGTHLKRALELRLELHPREHQAVLEGRVDYALFLVSDSRMDEAEQEVEQALPALRRAAPSAALVRALECMSQLRRLQENYASAETFAQEAWDLAAKVHGPQDVVTLEYQSEAGFAAYLGGRYRPKEDERLRNAEGMMRDALEQLTTLWPGRRFEINSAKVRLANLLAHRGEIAEAREFVEEAIAQRRDALGEDSKYLVSDLLVMSKILMEEDDYPGAERVVREALAMAERVNDEREQLRGHVFYRLSTILERDRPEEAAKWHGKAIDAWHACLGNHLTVAVQRRRLAEQLRSLGFYREAERSLHQSLEVLSDYPDRAQAKGLTHYRIADLLRASGDRERAVEHLRHAVALHDPKSILSTVARIDFIEVLIELGELEEAERESRVWIAAAQQTGVRVIKNMSRVSEAQLLTAAGEYETAVELLNRAYGQLRKNDPRNRARTQGLLAKCHVRMGDFESAERILLEQADDDSIALHPLEPRRVARQLVELYDSWDKPDKADSWREPSAR